MACGALRRTLRPEGAELALQHADALPRQTAVGLELGLARAAGADAAAESLEVLPHSPHPGKVVLELSELDLELSLGGARMLGEDVEDELRAIDHPELERVLEPALLAGIQVVVDHERLGAGLLHLNLQLLELAPPHVGARVGPGAVLDELPGGLDAGRAHQLTRFGQLVLLVELAAEHGDEKAALGLRAGRRIRLMQGHARDSATRSRRAPSG